MSAKNKLQNKRLRKAEREAGKALWSTFRRTPLSGFPRAGAVNVLANCKNKLTSPRRKRLMKALSFRIEVPHLKPSDPAVKLTLDLQKVPMVRLIRIIKHSARHASTCKHLAEKTTVEALKDNLLKVQTYHLGVLRQAQAEYNVRTSPRA